MNPTTDYAKPSSTAELAALGNGVNFVLRSHPYQCKFQELLKLQITEAVS
jgi:hypothetical protein